MEIISTNLSIFVPLLKILGILLSAIFLVRLSKKLVPKFLGEGFEFVKKTGLTNEEKRDQKRQKTILSALLGIVSVLVWIVAIMMILSELKIDITPIIASAGILGLAIGFGAQTLVKDMINGLFILSEDQFGEGDLIEVSGYKGKVERVNLRSVRLRDLSGTVYIIPNSRINEVANFSRDWAQVNLDLPFEISFPVESAMKLIRNVNEQILASKSIGGLILQKPKLVGIEELDLGKFVIKVVIKTEALKQFDVARKYRLLLKKELETYHDSKKNE